MGVGLLEGDQLERNQFVTWMLLGEGFG